MTSAPVVTVALCAALLAGCSPGTAGPPDLDATEQPVADVTWRYWDAVADVRGSDDPVDPAAFAALATSGWTTSLTRQDRGAPRSVLAAADSTDVRLMTVDVDGDHATSRVCLDGDHVEELRLVREAGRWLVAGDSPRGDCD